MEDNTNSVKQEDGIKPHEFNGSLGTPFCHHREDGMYCGAIPSAEIHVKQEENPSSQRSEIAAPLEVLVALYHIVTSLSPVQELGDDEFAAAQLAPLIESVFAAEPKQNHSSEDAGPSLPTVADRKSVAGLGDVDVLLRLEQEMRDSAEREVEQLTGALREMMRIYEQRIRSLCTPAQLEQQPWRVSEYVIAEQLVSTKGDN